MTRAIFRGIGLSAVYEFEFRRKSPKIYVPEIPIILLIAG